MFGRHALKEQSIHFMKEMGVDAVSISETDYEDSLIDDTSLIPLTHVKVGRSAKVGRLAFHDPIKLQMLCSMGVLPGVEIKLIQKRPSLLFQIGHGQFAIDAGIAEHILLQE